jgi:DeoR/GlpR family transcriptional regulator of sugar metabolism
VFLVEVFAFFFLKLYSQTLGELRHTHNEITNTEMKSSGLQVAIASADKKSIAHAAQSAIDTERNFVLDKGKTTIDLERYKSDGDQSAMTLNILREMFFPSSRSAIIKKGTEKQE